MLNYSSSYGRISIFMIALCFYTCYNSHGITKLPGNPPSITYSKSGSDSISLIIFGTILVKSAAEKKDVRNVSLPANKTAAKNDTSKEKDKFSIKSTDKLKTSSPLY